MTDTRIYKAVNPEADSDSAGTRFIKAQNQAQVGRHIARNWIITPASPQDIVDFRAVPIETAGT